MSASSTTSATSPSTGQGTLPAAHDSVVPVFVNPYASVNVKTHVPIELDLRLPNYNKWNAFFTAMCGKFGLLGHIDGTIATRLADPTWNQPDACVRSWMYGSVSDGVLDLAMAPDQTARDLYTAIRDLFQANQEPRAVILNQELASSTQGDLPIEAYAAQLKQNADALRDVGHPVQDRQLVLTLLNGLNPRLSNTADFIANTRPLPSFTSAVNMLRLKELRNANDNMVASNSALATSTTAACTSPSCRSTPLSSQPRGGGKGKGKGGGNGGVNSGGGGGCGGGRNQ